MNEMLSKLSECCKDKTVQEVADAIMSSKHGASVMDPLAVAAYIKSKG